MSDPPRVTVNAPDAPVPLRWEDLCGKAPQPKRSCPVDAYFEKAQALVIKAGDKAIASDPMLLALFLVELVATAEVYFRSVLARLVLICPLSREAARERSLPFDCVDYYQRDELALGLIEHAALSSKGEIVRQTQQLVGIEIKQGSSARVALEDFDRVCQLRHCIVHAGGELGMRNAFELGTRHLGRRRTHLDVLGFQGLAAKVNNAVRAYNQALFDLAMTRWIGRRVLLGSWKNDSRLFSGLFETFYSSHDMGDAGDAASAYEALMPRKP